MRPESKILRSVSGVSRGLAPLQMNSSRQPDRGADEEFNTAGQEEPGPGFGETRIEKENAADDEPDTDEDVVDDADNFVTLTDDQFVVAKVKHQIGWTAEVVRAGRIG